MKTRRKASKGVRFSKYKNVKPLRSSKKQIKRSLKVAKYMRRTILKRNEKNTLIKILADFKKGKDTKAEYSKNEKYIPSRVVVQKKIIKRFLKQDTSSKSPDVYIFGGPTASGKTSVLRKFVKERAIVINNDDIKMALAKHDPSPIKKYLLLHATLLHRESSDIETELVRLAASQKKDIILDRTLASYKKNADLIRRLKKQGYRVTTLGTNLPPHIAITRANARFIKKGRFVPLSVVAKKGNRINSNVLRLARSKLSRRSRVYSTVKRPVRLMFRK